MLLHVSCKKQCLHVRSSAPSGTQKEATDEGSAGLQRIWRRLRGVAQGAVSGGHIVAAAAGGVAPGPHVAVAGEGAALAAVQGILRHVGRVCILRREHCRHAQRLACACMGLTCQQAEYCTACGPLQCKKRPCWSTLKWEAKICICMHMLQSTPCCVVA